MGQAMLTDWRWLVVVLRPSPCPLGDRLRLCAFFPGTLWLAGEIDLPCQFFTLATYLQVIQVFRRTSPKVR